MGDLQLDYGIEFPYFVLTESSKRKYLAVVSLFFLVFCVFDYSSSYWCLLQVQQGKC